MFCTDIISITPGKVYTQKYRVLLENSVSEFHKKNYNLEIQNLIFHLPHVCIIRTHQCGNECHEAFKTQTKKPDVLC